jgi:hypothetical protein
MKKTVSLYLILILLFIGVLPVKLFVKKAYGWDVVIVAGIVWTSDQMYKWAEKTERSKAGTTTVYEPEPGYGEADRYWKFDDIVDHFADYHEDYSFINSYPPPEALAQLPSSPSHAASDISIANNKLSISASSQAVKFPWDTYQPFIKKGDIVFSRSNSLSAKAIQYVSSWVHTAVILSSDSKNPRSLESYADKGGPTNTGGVDIFNPLRDWSPGYSWSLKRLKSWALSESQVSNAVDYAKNMYAKQIPYFPKNTSSHIWRGDFISEWADQRNESSMYCSKLTWTIFKNVGVDLDSNRTKAEIDKSFIKSVMPGYGGTDSSNDFSWIGVSGDDIYFSGYLDTDIMLYGEENLATPIPGLAW